MQAGEGESLIYVEYETPQYPELFYIYKEYGLSSFIGTNLRD